MFNSLISKSKIQGDNIYLSPTTDNQYDSIIYISHGSSGISNNEWNIANFFLLHGFEVVIIDYFSKYNINRLFWGYDTIDRDTYNVSFKDIVENINFYSEKKIIHIGCSLGGFVGLYHAEKFYKNYCFYPGIICFTNKLIEKNYKNTKVILSKFDNWCDNYNIFQSLCKTPPLTITLPTYHSFMTPNKNIEIPIAKYNLPTKIVDDDLFNSLKPNHAQLSTMFGFEKDKILLLYNEYYCNICLTEILKEIISI